MQKPDNPPIFQRFEGLALRLSDGVLARKDWFSYEKRNDQTTSLLTCAILKYGVGDFDWVVIHTGDLCPDTQDGWITDDCGSRFPLLAYSTRNRNYGMTIPDFVFKGWKETGLEDYESTRRRLIRLDRQPPETGMLGWRGAETHPIRTTLTKYDDKVNYDIELIRWDRSTPERLIAKNFISLLDQVAKWRFLIDVQGAGYSGRLKLLLASGRPVFIQERSHHEFFYKDLVPWRHYVPIRSDLSDLRDKFELLSGDMTLERSIIQEARDFSAKYLTLDYAEFYAATILNQMSLMVR
jgi:hypothetical protein